ncbi:MAG: hypothetical protein QMC81_11690 [Thermoanaerobacterales bacterium]|nr:hypothetical protein [Thermoanaerobacterales bacterium]
MRRTSSITLSLIFMLFCVAVPAAAEPGEFSCVRSPDGSVTIRWNGGEEGKRLSITRLDILGHRLGPPVTVEQTKGEFRDLDAPAEAFCYEVAWGPLGRSALFLAVPAPEKGIEASRAQERGPRVRSGVPCREQACPGSAPDLPPG